ncbi:MAG: RluA family pseudouridine synthase [Anaerovoracaceae bacterium]|nr:RluA family pseudouridine synthase [Anaerovoracaceae bacterium]
MAEINHYEITVDEKYSGTRLDLVLSVTVEESSRSYIQKLIAGGSVTVNGAVETSKKYKVAEGDVVEISVPEPEELTAEPEDIPLDIVYEDSDVIVVNKPAGMVVHPAAGTPDGTLVNALLYHCRGSLSSINGVIRPGIVHRIDKDTSGLIMAAKNDAAHRSLAAQLERHSVTRAYRAIVYNAFREEEGTVDAPIGRGRKNRLRMEVYGINAKNAVTHYKVTEKLGRFSLIECRLETGRTHQIRVHMAYINHPLLGDSVYGPAKQRAGARRQMLHAYLLGFVHPSTGEYLEFETDPPEDFENVLSNLRRRAAGERHG